MAEYPNLAKDVGNAPKFIMNERGRYVFRFYSVGERGARLSPELVDEVLNGLAEKIRPLAFDYLVSVEPGGNQWGLLVAHELKVPLAIVRQQETGLKGEFKVRQTGGFYKRDLFFQGFKRGDRVVIVDDVISTGGTTRTVIDALESKRVTIAAIFAIIGKGDEYLKVQNDKGISVDCLMQVGVG